MSIARLPIDPSAGSTQCQTLPPRLASIHENLERWFETELPLFDTAADVIVESGSDKLPSLPAHWGNLCRETANRERPEFIICEEALFALAFPIPGGPDQRYVAVGLFLSHRLESDADFDRLAQVLGWSRSEIGKWAARHDPWQPTRLLALAESIHGRLAAELRVQILATEDHELSANISAMYEEISLLHRLTQHLRITESNENLARLALEWLGEAVPAESMAIELFPVPGASGSPQPGRSESNFLTLGDCPFDAAGFRALIDELGLDSDARALVINSPSSSELRDHFPRMRQAVLVPLFDGQHLFGWLGAFGHRNGGEFGSPEANLLGSVSAILAVHASNSDLYRQQAEFLASMVRALTSAIDAKDPYTCGHSDRVARIAVALATALECDRKQLETIYLSGLLHDIGKIGINDYVLRKTSKLTDAEYEHIKLHTEIGYKILCDLKQLGDVLPVVRHHHEAWNGAGYPSGLSGEQIPLLARIVAVADAIDAMSSDRPYRKGMPDERLDEILRQGSGSQWDARVVEAFFRIRDQIRQFVRREPEDEPVIDEVRHLS
ncbi:MAG TPA: HD-GYP domain-containing protein [Pirellulales bacterium]|jgi:HD-GYP domain-containing protein (c-di-GMP phosphodiesterase class II)|nr:HD-GYP domain-containing protein [Pirellulales bacterium]